MGETRKCIKCGKKASNPMLPLCVSCDLIRLEKGETADDIKREAAALKKKD